LEAELTEHLGHTKNASFPAPPVFLPKVLRHPEPEVSLH